MVERLSPLDASFLFAEDGARSSMHVGAVALFDEPEGGLDVERLRRFIGARLAMVPRFRQKVRFVPGGIARPVWVDDADFDLDLHVRTAVLPRPGGLHQLDELVERLMARPLDRSRPLWEIVVVTGLRRGKFAVITKTHHALVDGVASVDVMQVLLSPRSDDTAIDDVDWHPEPAPSDIMLVSEAATDVMRTPAQLLDLMRRASDDVGGALRSAAGALSGIAATLRAVAPSPGPSPLVAETPSQRRVFRRVDATLASHREIRTRYGTTVNDVVLAVVAGGLRGWLQARGEVLAGTTTVRAMVPVSLRGHHASGDGPADGADPRTGNVVSAFFVDLPVGEPVAAIRLQQIAMAMKGLKDAGQPLGARSVISVVGNGPTTMHAMAARVVNAMSDRVFGLTVTNIPGPQMPLYLCGALMRSVHPVPPLAHRQALSVAVSSYDGTLGYGLIADAEAVPDLDVLAESIEAAIAELREHRPRRRPKSAAQA